MDPLSVLRDFNTSSKLDVVQQVDGNVQFGDRYSFPVAMPVYKAAFAQAASAYYSLQDVLFYLKNRHLKPQEYVMAANQSGVANISIVDRKRILDVLDGIAALDPSLVPPTAAAAAAVAAGAPREAAPSSEPQAKRQRLIDVDEASAMKGLMEQERQLRNRNTMLLAPNKDFCRVLEVVMDVKKQAATRKQEGAGARMKGGGAPSSSQRQVDPRGTSSRGDPKSAVGAGSKGTAPPPPPPPPPSGSGGYVPARKSTAASQPGPQAGPPPPPPPPMPQGSAAAAKGAKPHVGGGSSGGGSSSKAGHQQPSGKLAPAGAGAARGPAGGGSGGVKGDGGGVKKGGGVPIIIVPSGLTSMINMYNARAFLEEGRFVPAAQAQASVSGAPKPSSLTFRRTAHRAPPGVEYCLVERAPAAGSADWERVVAVVVQGAKWQFKDWPHKGAKDGDLMETLGKVCGFYVHFADEKVASPVSDWNVRTVPLHREDRHKDMTAMLEMYRHLDVFLQAKRSTLSY